MKAKTGSAPDGMRVKLMRVAAQFADASAGTSLNLHFPRSLVAPWDLARRPMWFYTFDRWVAVDLLDVPHPRMTLDGGKRQ